MGLTPHGGELEAPLLAAGFVCIGSSIDDSQTMLAMQVNGDDRHIYVYTYDGVSDAVSESSARPTVASPTPSQALREGGCRSSAAMVDSSTGPVLPATAQATAQSWAKGLNNVES